MSLTTESVSETVIVERCYCNIAPDPLDTNVNEWDLAVLAQGFGQLGTLPGDVDPAGTKDGDVDGLDLFGMSQELGRTNCPILVP